jgi:hypothetical protein
MRGFKLFRIYAERDKERVKSQKFKCSVKRQIAIGGTVLDSMCKSGQGSITEVVG